MLNASYEPIDPTFGCYDHAIAELRVGNEVRAYLACVVGSLASGGPWPWYCVVWPNGLIEPSQEDYGPLWPAVQEWDAGKFEYWEHPPNVNSGLFGSKIYTRDSDEILYDAVWLSPEEAAEKWQELGLRDSDF